MALRASDFEDPVQWAESERDFARLCQQDRSVLLLSPLSTAAAAADPALHLTGSLDGLIRAAVPSADSKPCFSALESVLSGWLERCGHVEPPLSQEALTRVTRRVVYHLTVKPAMETCLSCKLYPPAMYQPKFLLACSSGGGELTRALRVITCGFVGAPALGDRPDTKATPYCELQYKCQLSSEFSVENAETMENYPWKMMILY